MSDLDIGSLSRRGVLKSALALGSALSLGGGVSRAFAAPTWPSLKGQSINVLIIQPHVVTGEILAREFEAATGAKVTITPVPYDQVQAKATLDVQSGAGVFDVLDYWYESVGALAEDGVLVDLTAKIDADADIKADGFLPAIYDTYTLHKGKRWGVPYDGDTHVLFVNTEILGKHGLKAPKTWDEYLENAKIITEHEKANGIYGAAVLGYKAPIILGSTYANRLAGFGGRFLKADGTPDLLSDAAIGAAKALLAVAPHALPTPLETAFEQGLPAFLSGKAAQIEFWTDLGVYAQDPKGSKIVDKWDVVQIPTGGTNTKSLAPLNAGFGFGISSASKKADAAWAFIRYAVSRDVHLRLLNTAASGIDPIRVSELESPEYKAFAPKVQAAASAALNGALAWPTIPRAPELLQTLSDELALVLAGSKAPEKALADANAAWVRILNG